MAIAKKKHAWSWPANVDTVPDLLMATDLGFELVEVMRGAYADRPYFALMREGLISPTSKINQGMAHASCQIHFEFVRKLPSGTLVYRRKPKSS